MIVSIVATLAMAQGGFSPLQPSHQFLAGEALSWASESPRFQFVVWPSIEAATAPHDLVPQALWEERDLWLRRMLKSEWVPSDLKARTLAFRQYRDNDVLAFRYRKDGYDVQVMDLYGKVTLAVKGPQRVILPASSAEIIGLVKDSMQRFLNLTPAELAMILVDGTFLTSPPDTVYSYLVDSVVPYQFVPPWWRAQGFSDGQTVYISMSKSLDEKPTSGAKQASTENLGLRFLPGG